MMTTPSVGPVGDEPEGEMMGSEAEANRREAIAGFHCDVDAAISVIGGKWKLHIVWLLLERTCRFKVLRREMPNISQKILTQSLCELKAD